VAEISLKLFAEGKRIALQQGLILVDTKYEFGVDESGTVTLADELHTPDSSRYWKLNNYNEKMESGAEPEGLDKEFLRLWIREHCDPYKDPIPDIPDQTLREFSKKYISLYEAVTGKQFVPENSKSEILERIRKNIMPLFPEYFT
jgi:phosphoribosylaminoimidazole-succinocarboxamide synthase